MPIPTFANIRIDENKLTGYVLNLNHPEGRHKARVFRSALGLTISDAPWLAQAIKLALPETRMALQSQSEWGSIYRSDILLHRGNRCAKVRTAWLCTDQETRLVTCFVIGECDENT
ncbi:MAG: hypothetical protein H6935_08135 [Thiobacillus sp.]|nr:hypothetical protein [Thiobacillus sp.]